MTVVRKDGDIKKCTSKKGGVVQTEGPKGEDDT